MNDGSYKNKEKCAMWHINHRVSHLAQMKKWREAHPNYFKQWRKKQIDRGNCPRCGAPLIEGEGRHCVACVVGRHIPVRA